jgi:hypothetical protein
MDDPSAQLPTRNWTWLESTSTEPMVPLAMWAEVTPPVAMPIVPVVVIGPPVSPDPLPTLVTVPALVSSTSHTTDPSALTMRMDDPAAQFPVTRT